jgi:hypothetical protein
MLATGSKDARTCSRDRMYADGSSRKREHIAHRIEVREALTITKQANERDVCTMWFQQLKALGVEVLVGHLVVARIHEMNSSVPGQ